MRRLAPRQARWERSRSRRFAPLRQRRRAKRPWKDHEQSNPSGTEGGQRAPDHLLRRQMGRLRNGLRPYSRHRVRNCGRTRLGGSVGLVIDGEGVARFRGVAVCGSLWECPHCQMAIKTGRTQEVTQAVSRHGQERVAMLTLTVRHARSDDLKALRRSLANAYRAFTRGAPWKRFCRDIGLSGAIRSLEITHGPNGFHPHLHVLLFLDRQGLPSVLSSGIPTAEWLAARWADMVERHIGARFVPTRERGVELTPCRDAGYLAKLGLELSDPGAKNARSGHRTPLQVAADLAHAGSPADAAIWRAYCEGMRGARQLTWSHGLKKRLAIENRTDAELAADEPAEEPTPVLTISGAAWDRMRDRWVGDTPAPIWLLQQTERGGAAAARRALRVLTRPDPPEPGPNPPHPG